MYLSRLFSMNKEFDLKIKYIHGKKECGRCAFSFEQEIALILYVPRLVGATEVLFKCHSDNLQCCCSYKFEWNSNVDGYDRYILKIPAQTLAVGLYSYNIELHSGASVYYATGPQTDIRVTNDKNLAASFQLTVSDFIYNGVEEYFGGIIYQIFVDRFHYDKRMPLKPGAEYVDSWDTIPEFPAYPGAPLKNNKFYGGNLYGIIEKLPYIASLGTTLIYLSPIFESPSNHKYDTADYLKVDEMFGGDEALKELINKAETYGIKIILDGVFNHTGNDSVYFNQYGNYDSLGAYQSLESPYFSWYTFDSHPDKYTCWWGIEILPRINPDVESCYNFFLDENGVVDKYMKLGIAGLRLDVVDELSDSFVKGIKARMKAVNPSAILYGEVWEDASNKIAYDNRKQYYLGAELDGVMNYPVRVGIIEYLNNKDACPLRYALTDIYNNAPEQIANLQMNLLGSHDTIRILTALANEDVSGIDNAALSVKRLNSCERAKAIKKLKQAYCILTTIPGIPTIFYGDESGLEGYSDPFNRMPYPWGNEETELLDFYKQMGSVRRSNGVFTKGDFNLIELSSDLLIYERILVSKKAVVVINNTDKILRVNFNTKATPQLQGCDEFIGGNGCQVYLTNATSMHYSFDR